MVQTALPTQPAAFLARWEFDSSRGPPVKPGLQTGLQTHRAARPIVSIENRPKSVETEPLSIVP